MRSKSSAVRSIPSRPAIASRCTTALVEPPMAASATIAFWKGPLGQEAARPPPPRPPARPRAGRCGGRPPAGGCPAPGSRPGRAGRCQGLGDQGHGRGGPHRVAVPAAADHRGLRAQEVLLRQGAGPDLLAEPPDVSAAAERHAAERPGEHRPARDDDRRQVRPTRPPSAARGWSCRTRRAGRPRRSGWPRSISSVASRPGCATASPSAGPVSPRARPPAAPAGRRRPRARRRGPRPRPRPGARCRAFRSEAVLAMAICGRPRKASAGAPRRIQARWM